MADDSDPWTQRFQNIDKLMKQPAAGASTPPASTSTSSTTPPATTSSDTPTPGWGHDITNAFVGGIGDVGRTIARNLGMTPNPLPQDVQTAMAAHPYVSGAGSLLGGTAAAIPIALGGAEIAAGVGAGTGLASSILTGAGTGAVQNALTGSPDQPLWERAGVGAGLGAGLGAVANRVGNWFGAGKSIEQDVANAAKNAQSEGVTDIKLPNLPGGNIKAMGATPTYEQSGQIDNAVSKILGEDVPDFKPANLNKVKNSIGGDVSKAANSGQINAAPGGAFDQALTQVQQFANANGAGASINPLVNQIRARIQNGVISGRDFDNLVGNGSPLHDLTGDDNPFVKQAAQALDKVMDSGFQASSPQGAYDAWVDARTKYRMLMGVQKALLPNGHVNPTTLFNAIQNRFTDLKGTPVTSDPLVGRMGQFADSIRTLFGGGSAPPPQAGSGLLRTLGIGGAGGAAPEIIPQLLSGDFFNPENYLTPGAMAVGGAGAAAIVNRLGQLYQQSPRFVNALINAGGSPIGNPLARYAPAIGTADFPRRQAQP